MVSRYDHIVTGLVAAFAVAFIGYGLLLQLQDILSESFATTFAFRERSVALIAIALTVIPMSYFRKRYHNRSLRGLVIGTMIMAAAWFFYYGRDLLEAT